MFIQMIPHWRSKLDQFARPLPHFAKDSMIILKYSSDFLSWDRKEGELLDRILPGLTLSGQAVGLLESRGLPFLIVAPIIINNIQ
jgi:hypothetical protein